MSVPLIAIPGRIGPQAANVRGPAFGVGQAYLRAVHRAGGQATMLPPVMDGTADADPDRMLAVMARFDGVVLHGGGDIDPRRYGQAPSAESLYGIVPEHDDIEFAVLGAALQLGLPVLAICRGMQLLNVHLGGTLVQDLGTDAHWHTHHPVQLTAGCRLAAALGTERPERCHSVHHQALDVLGDGLVPVGHADDDTLEAVELEGPAWVAGIQWHAEDTAVDDEVQQRLFDRFVDRCRV